MGSDRLTRHAFPAMGCQVEVHLVHDREPDPGDVRACLHEAERLFRGDEARLSRFLPTSELSALNRTAGTGPVRVSRPLLDVTAASLRAAAATDGLFDPTLGTMLARLGYDRPFPFPAADGAIPVHLPPHRHGAWRQIAVDVAAHTIALPEAVALDFGGIGKGWAVDRAVALLRRRPGIRGGLVDAGGDLRAWGTAPDGEDRWVIGVEDPGDPAHNRALLRIRDQAVATSSIMYRRWRQGDRWVHHLLDPRTGRPALTDLAAVTVIGPSALWAEVHAKVALLLGADDGRAYLARQTGYAGLGMALLEDLAHSRSEVTAC